MVTIDRAHLRFNKEHWLKFKDKYVFNNKPALSIISNKKVVSAIEWDEKRLSEIEFDTWLQNSIEEIKSIKH